MAYQQQSNTDVSCDTGGKKQSRLAEDCAVGKKGFK